MVKRRSIQRVAPLRFSPRPVTNLYLAMERNLKIIPIITKIDLPTAEPDRVKKEIVDFLGVDEKDIILSSAKTGEGAEEILTAILEKIPPPQGDMDKPLRALIFDSKFDSYQGVVAYFRIIDGKLRTHDQVLMMQTHNQHEVDQVGIFNPNPEVVEELGVGAVGYMNANIKDISEVSDKSVAQILMALRLFMPRLGIALSTRESALLRENLLPLGITRMSAGSTTRVGGHTIASPEEENAPQFEISDPRDVEEMKTMLAAKGYQPVLKDWMQL